ncbi:hypothetical protein T01_16172 [Trichinella spiralis]|uniref:Uncharacterized protein n=1 Tax=Trichinella spiralis TaxID=6334 RepID=A0A0V0Z211_TRISP|nr:hypothetical protein T01_16172 [Trichinella spiralis]
MVFVALEYASIFEHLCFTAITQLIRQRTDPKAAQLFRLIQAENVVAQSEVFCYNIVLL